MAHQGQDVLSNDEVKQVAGWGMCFDRMLREHRTEGVMAKVTLWDAIAFKTIRSFIQQQASQGSASARELLEVHPAHSSRLSYLSAWRKQAEALFELPQATEALMQPVNTLMYADPQAVMRPAYSPPDLFETDNHTHSSGSHTSLGFGNTHGHQRPQQSFGVNYGRGCSDPFEGPVSYPHYPSDHERNRDYDRNGNWGQSRNSYQQGHNRQNNQPHNDLYKRYDSRIAETCMSQEAPAREIPTATSKTTKCWTCKHTFQSRNALFRHLNAGCVGKAKDETVATSRKPMYLEEDETTALPVVIAEPKNRLDLWYTHTRIRAKTSPQDRHPIEICVDTGCGSPIVDRAWLQTLTHTIEKGSRIIITGVCGNICLNEWATFEFYVQGYDKMGKASKIAKFTTSAWVQDGLEPIALLNTGFLDCYGMDILFSQKGLCCDVLDDFYIPFTFCHDDENDL